MEIVFFSVDWGEFNASSLDSIELDFFSRIMYICIHEENLKCEDATVILNLGLSILDSFNAFSNSKDELWIHVHVGTS